MTEPVIVMVGTALENKGGIAAVVNVYRELGLFKRWPIHYVATHVDGSRLQKLIKACSGALIFTGLLVSRRVALVHVHTASGSSFWRKFYFMLLTLATGRKLVLHVHGGNFDAFAIKQTRSWARALIRFVLRRATRIIALSEHWRQWFTDFAPGCRVSVLFNPVQLPIQTERGVHASPMLLFLGKMCRDKGNYDLLEAMALILQRHPHVRLVCAGDGEADAVMAHARKLGIDHAVETPGWVAGEAKSRLFQEATIFVLPSYFEGMPMSILEAMAHAVPVVATPVGGIPEMLDDAVEGLLVPPGDVHGLTHALSALLDDPERARQMGRAGRERVSRQFAATPIVGQLEEIYRELGAIKLI